VSIRLIDYRVYCNSPHWIGLRTRLFAERGGCEACGYARKLTLHHLRYTRRGESILWKECDEDLMVLCWECHQAWETYCKGHQLNETVKQRLQDLFALGLERDIIYPAVIAANFSQLYAGYVQERNRREAERKQSRLKWQQPLIERMCAVLLSEVGISQS